jgi:hypothetical protein
MSEQVKDEEDQLEDKDIDILSSLASPKSALQDNQEEFDDVKSLPEQKLP